VSILTVVSSSESVSPTTFLIFMHSRSLWQTRVQNSCTLLQGHAFLPRIFRHKSVQQHFVQLSKFGTLARCSSSMLATSSSVTLCSSAILSIINACAKEEILGVIFCENVNKTLKCKQNPAHAQTRL
jgi:hypothetical protein